MPKNLLVAVVMLSAAVSFAESAGGLSWKAPAGWVAQPERPMRAATYTVAPAKGDTEGAECAVFYFGPGQGGAVEANLTRWIGQFEQPDGSPSAKAAKIGHEKVGAMNATSIELPGTYAGGMSPMMDPAAPKTSKKNYRLLGAIVEGPEGAVFFKVTGPTRTVEAARGDFKKLVASLKK